MPDYGQYRLSNSKLTKPFQGSTLNEMIKVSDVMQQRYDATQSYMDQLDEFMKSAKALPQDKPLLEQRKAEYKAKLQEFAKRGDLENITRDVYKAGRDFANEYQNFANSYKAFVTHKEDLDKQVEGKKISKQTADDKLRMSTDMYRGMQFDPKTGEYKGGYSGEQVAPEVDINDWIKKVAGDVAASKNKSFQERADGFYFVGAGGSSEKVDWETQILPAIREAYALDPSIQSDFDQRAGIAGWKGSKISVDQIPDNNPLKAKVQELIKSGMSEAEAMSSTFKDLTKRDLINKLERYGNKYAYQRTESERRIGGKTMAGEEYLKSLDKPADTLLSLSVTTPGSGMSIKSATDFQTTTTQLQTDHDNVMKEYNSWLNGKQKDSNGHVYQFIDGKKVDVTDKANEFRNRLRPLRAEIDNLTAIKNEAAKEAGYDPTKNITDKLRKEADKYADLQLAYKSSGPISYTQSKEDYQKELEAERAKYRNEYIAKNSPGYKEFENILKSKLNSNAETSSITLIQDPTVKKAWSDNLTALTSDLGLKEGALSFTIGSGPDQGKQITASQYRGIQGDVDVVGFETDKNGQTVIKLRAFKDIAGKKTNGKDIILNLGNTDVDKWLQSNMNPQEFLNFKREGFLKKELNNKARRAEIEIPGTSAVAKIRLENNRWIVSLPGQGGTNEQIADSYMGILNILDNVSKLYK